MLKFQNVLFQQIMKLIFSELQLPGAVLKPIPHINPKQHNGHLLFVAAPTPLAQALQTHVAAAVGATLRYLLNPTSTRCPTCLHFSPAFQRHYQTQGRLKPPHPTDTTSGLLFGPCKTLLLLAQVRSPSESARKPNYSPDHQK